MTKTKHTIAAGLPGPGYAFGFAVASVVAVGEWGETEPGFALPASPCGLRRDRSGYAVALFRTKCEKVVEPIGIEPTTS